MGADCKSAAECYGGSNPSPATMIARSTGLVMISALTGAGRSERSHAEPDCESKTDLLKIPLVAPIAQSAERLHGKEKVKGSIPFRGSDTAGAKRPPLC